MASNRCVLDKTERTRSVRDDEHVYTTRQQGKDLNIFVGRSVKDTLIKLSSSSTSRYYYRVFILFDRWVPAPLRVPWEMACAAPLLMAVAVPCLPSTRSPGPFLTRMACTRSRFFTVQPEFVLYSRKLQQSRLLRHLAIRTDHHVKFCIRLASLMCIGCDSDALAGTRRALLNGCIVGASANISPLEAGDIYTFQAGRHRCIVHAKPDSGRFHYSMSVDGVAIAEFNQRLWSHCTRWFFNIDQVR